MVRCVVCGREVDARDAVYVERSNDFYYSGVEGFVCRDCWCSGRFNIGCGGDCPDCPLYYYCWKWCEKVTG
ncbi:hypothetical protein DRN86_03605 [Candidatus Geothermarchaeota archaeon]|nr:MAG: hypothetical protein DRN86_03605 [Candidatus Geothermarchaeota archaeon]